MRARFIDVDGIATRLLVAGKESSPVLFLIHGFGSSADTWVRNLDALGEHYHVIAPDQIGHGFTDRVPLGGKAPHAVSLRHLFGVLRVLGIDRFVPCGSSYGALLATLMYFEDPGRVPKLVINGSGSAFNTDEELATGLEKAQANGAIAFLDPTLESCHRRSLGTIHDPATLPAALPFMRLTAYSQPWALDAWREQITAMRDLDLCRPYRILDRLEQLDVDTLIVWGREDPRGVYARAVEAQKRLPRARLVTFEQCGHLPFLEQPERYNRELLAFLAG